MQALLQLPIIKNRLTAFKGKQTNDQAFIMNHDSGS